jgi:prefoldin subunit 5
MKGNTMEKGPSDLEERIDQLEKQKLFLQEKCRQAGQQIKELQQDNKKLASEVSDYIDRITKNNRC